MAEVNLLRALPRSKRNIAQRGAAKSPEVIAESRRFGQMYFDGPRDYGYGGYRYDGRWLPVARDMVEHFGLKPGMRVLDVGCAKGFLVRDLMTACPGLEVFGLDISHYAMMNCRAFVQVDSYRTPEEKELFESWVLTAFFHDYPDKWIELFNEAGYTGDHYWTIVE